MNSENFEMAKGTNRNIESESAKPKNKAAE